MEKKLEEIVDLNQDAIDNILVILWAHQKMMVSEHDELMRLKAVYKKRNRLSILNTAVTLSAIAYMVVASQIILHQEEKIQNTDNMLASMRRKQQQGE